MRKLPLSMLIALCACQGEAPPAQPQPSASASAAADIPAASDKSVATLEGIWRVVSIDGQPLADPYALRLYGTGRLIYWDPPCAGLERRYAIDGTQWSASLPPSESPRVVCDIYVPDEVVDVFAVLDDAHTIERSSDASVLIVGYNRRVTLSR